MNAQGQPVGEPERGSRGWRSLGAALRVDAEPGDPPEVTLQKHLLVTITLLILPAAFLWGMVYLAFGETRAGLIPWGYGLVSLVGLATVRWTGRFHLFRAIQLGLWLVLPFLLQIELGGFVPGSAVSVWAFCAPISALLVASRRAASTLMVIFALLVVAAVVVQPLAGTSNALPVWLVAALFGLNLVGTAVVTYRAMVFFIVQKDQAYAQLGSERARSERLLLNVLPAPIADRLKQEESVIADRFEAVSVLFADIVGFTPLSAGMSADELVALLDGLFGRLDDMTRRRGLEKIRTIGDAYMVASGVPTPRVDHALVLVDLGLEMLQVAQNGSGGHPLQLRVGISSGPAVAGVIGRTKFQYDLWGDTVNTASRMESHGVPGRIHISESTLLLIEDAYICEARGIIDVKGKGPMSTYFVVGPRG
ncbi:MAG TPA: adenylate/guanylate cyclase domain-containing protein [Ornithinibacter sp.]|nr:adenylate/guanylate cyclase domain-containing protein [Ornithinibacter sp.]